MQCHWNSIVASLPIILKRLLFKKFKMCCKSAIIMAHIVSNPVIVIINNCLATYLFLRSSHSQFVSLALTLNLSHFVSRHRLITREVYFTSIYKPHYSFSLAQTSQAARLEISNKKGMKHGTIMNAARL